MKYKVVIFYPQEYEYIGTKNSEFMEENQALKASVLASRIKKSLYEKLSRDDLSFPIQVPMFAGWKVVITALDDKDQFQFQVEHQYENL